MSTVNQEPTFGQPQVGMQQIGMPNIPGMQQMPNLQGVSPQVNTEQQAAQQAAQAAQMVQQAQAQQAQAQQATQVAQTAQMGIPSVNMPGMQPQVELPTIQDNNPTAEMPTAGVLQAQQQAQMNQMPQQNQMVQGMPQVPGMQQMGQAGIMQPQVDQAAQNFMAQQQAQVAQQTAVPQHLMGQTGMSQGQPQPQVQLQQMGYYGQGQVQQAQPQAQAQPQYNQQYNPQMQPGMTAPGAPQGSYLPGGNMGGTPTGHPEKQKFQGQARLIFVKNRPTKKGTTITTGLLATNMNDRNAAASNFVCFSGSAAKQIDILENPQVRPQYTNIEKASGQTIMFEGSWEWNSKSREPGWQLMMDNFVFVNDQNLRNIAESYVPPVPPSPMDMLNGGMMQGQQMYGQPQMAPNYGQPQMAQQGMPQSYGQPQGQPMPNYGQPMPGMGQPMPNYGQPMPGMPGMQGMPGMVQ